MTKTVERWLETMLAGGADSATAVYTTLKEEFAATDDQPVGWMSQTVCANPLITAQLGCRSARPLRVNAQHVDVGSRQYIACEGPSRATAHDFWTLVWQERVGSIVSLNFPFEERLYPSSYDRNRETVQYWPLATTQSLLFVPFRIECVDVQNRTVGGRVRTLLSDEVVFRVSKLRLFLLDPILGSPPYRDVVHICYYRWPDGRIPLAEPAHRSLADAARTFVSMINLDLANAADPVLVHCHAGIGRTGAFVVLDLALRQLRHAQTMDVNGLLERVRSKRPRAVINHCQYIWIHLVLIEQALHCGCGGSVLSPRNAKYRGTADALWDLLKGDLAMHFLREESGVAAWHSYRSSGQRAMDGARRNDANVEEAVEEDVDDRRDFVNHRLLLFEPSAANASASHRSMSSSSTIGSAHSGFVFSRRVAAPTQNYGFHRPQPSVQTAPPQPPPIPPPRTVSSSSRIFNSWAGRRHKFYGDATIRNGEESSASAAGPSTSRMRVEAAFTSPSNEQLTRMMGGRGLFAATAVPSSSSHASIPPTAADLFTERGAAYHSSSRARRSRRRRSGRNAFTTSQPPFP